MGLVAVIGMVVGGTVLLLGRPLLGLYISGDSINREAVIAAGMVRLSIMAASYFLCGVMDVGNGILRGFGRSISPMLISLTGACLLRILWVATIFKIFKTQRVIYFSYPISWFLTAVTLYILVFFTYRSFKKRISEDTLPTL